MSPRPILYCKTQYELHVGPLSVPAGGLRTFLANGPSVFLTFEEAWKREEEPRRAKTWQAQGVEASSNLPRGIFSERSLHFHHFEARKDASWSRRCRNHCNVCPKLATPKNDENARTIRKFWLLGTSWGPLGGVLWASWGHGCKEASSRPLGGLPGASWTPSKNN